MPTITTIHRLQVCLAYQIVLQVWLNNPRLQYYPFDMQYEVGLDQANVIFI